MTMSPFSQTILTTAITTTTHTAVKVLPIIITAAEYKAQYE